MRTAAIAFVASVLLAAGLLRIRTFIQTRGASSGYLAIAATAAGLAVLLNAPGPYTWLDRTVFRHPNTSVLVSHILTSIGAAAAGEMVAVLVSNHQRVGRPLRRVAEGLTIAAMVATFAVGAPGREDAFFFEHFKDDRRLSAYWAIFLGSVTIQLSYVALLTLRYTGYDDKWLGRGLRFIGYGSACVALFLATRVIEVVAPNFPHVSDASALSLLVVGGALLATGVLLPQVGLRADRAIARRRLYPLWETVTRDYVYVRASTRRPTLYRSVIEVQDALAEARSQHKTDTPLFAALETLTPRTAEQFDAAVEDLLAVLSILGPTTGTPRADVAA